MSWIRRTLRGTPVYVKVDADGHPAADARGRVEVVYKLSPGAKVYRASLTNLQPTGDPADERPLAADSGRAPQAGGGGEGRVHDAPPTRLPRGAVVVYTDGACTGNPGPMGIGVVVRDGERVEEISDFLGIGTNNIAELTAIERALRAVGPERRDRPVYLHTDSSYSIGVLGRGWKARANADLVARIRELAAAFSDLHFVKVRGHAGVPDNERCDELARSAITTRA